ncbi:sensor histidine kinase [Streptomyces dysideae]|uniref:histidine kinase n=1 Tax=Streptomyces dysideae TaxID=909626 RepID=A0A101UZ01_9ACTN|nr:ATP-binding protein [Streptomyces dysideae]KUO19527.1 hypothetical protein AQJ91_19425 [Streptomyces dysideae]
MPTERAVALLRPAQGLPANAPEHARATHIQVTLVPGDTTAALEIRDDGVGFDPASPRVKDGCRGFGLAAAHDRLAALGGTLTVDSAQGRGTRVRATLPAADRVPVGAR